MIEGSTRCLWLACVLTGVLVLVFRAGFASAMPGSACGAAPTQGGSLVAFQLATNTEAMRQVFGAPEGTCARNLAAAMERANRIDLAFAPIYGLLLATFFLASGRECRPGLAHVGLVVVAVTVGADWLETTTQLGITSRLPGTANDLLVMSMASRTKFIGFAVIAWTAGAVVFRRGGTWAVVGGIMVLAGCAILLGLTSPSQRGLLMLGAGVNLLLVFGSAIARFVGRGPLLASWRP